MNSPSSIDLKLAEEAAGWVQRRRHDTSQRCDNEFREWLLRSPNHIDEFLVAKLTYSLLRDVDPERKIDIDDLLDNEANSVIPLRDKPFNERSAVPRAETIDQADQSETQSAIRRDIPRRWRRGAALAAAAIAAVMVALTWIYGLNTSVYSTERGQHRTVTLIDGSSIELNTHSKVRVRFAKNVREVELVEGEALFKVAHDLSRPFRVSARRATIEAVGTQFDVYLASDIDTRVAVVEGRVKIAQTAGPAESLTSKMMPWQGTSNGTDTSLHVPVLLAAGEEASVSRQGHIRIAEQPNISQAVAWRKGRLVFHNASIAEVIKEFSRYSDFQFSLLGESLSKRQISGVFHADNPQTLVSLFEGDKTVEVTHVSNGVVVRLR